MVKIRCWDQVLYIEINKYKKASCAKRRGNVLFIVLIQREKNGQFDFLA